MRNSFVKLINTERGSMHFNFLPVYTVRGLKYFVTVLLSSEKSYLFSMEQEDDDWRIIDAPKVPHWIHDAREELVEAIRENSN